MSADADDARTTANWRAVNRFEAAYAHGGEAVLAEDDGTVLAVVGELARSLAAVGSALTNLAGSATSPDLASAIDRVVNTAALSEPATITLADGLAVSASVVAVRPDDGLRRYLIVALSLVVPPEELNRLRRDEVTYALWFERAPMGVCLVANDGTFLRTNPAYCRLVGRSQKELRHLTFQAITHPDDLLLDVSLVQEVLDDKIDRYDIDKRYIRPDGSIVWVHLTVALVREETGAPRHLIAMVEDINERRLVEQRLQQTVENLSLAYREKVGLVTALSHDLRAPVAAIRILAQVLVDIEEASAEVDPERRDLSRRLLLEATRTEGVLSDLVSSERLTAGLLTPQRVAVKVNALVERAVELQGIDAAHAVSVELCSSDPEVSADPALLERIIANLVSNAFRHTPAGSSVWVRVVTESDRTLTLTVEDDGDGIVDDLKEVIFAPYARLAGSDRPGTGIGLFLVRSFAEFHGGTAVCCDRVGGGASFQVSLPQL